MQEGKTYKREISAALLAFCCYLAWADKIEALEAFIWPAFIFAGASYGMDWASKQTDLTNRKDK